MAGLKSPGTAIQSFHSSTVGFETKLNDIRAGIAKNTIRGHVVQSRSWLFDESRVYALLMRSNSPASEPFRKWVTEEVLPTIRKTGKYNAEESTNPIAQGVMDELKTLRGEVGELKGLIEILMSRPSIAKNTIDDRTVNARGWLFIEARVYSMLLRGHAPASVGTRLSHSAVPLTITRSSRSLDT